jgi:hypothetical protein
VRAITRTRLRAAARIAGAQRLAQIALWITVRGRD